MFFYLLRKEIEEKRKLINVPGYSGSTFPRGEQNQDRNKEKSRKESKQPRKNINRFDMKRTITDKIRKIENKLKLKKTK